MSEVHERIHAAGVLRHPEVWLAANIRACDGAAASGLTTYTEPGKTAIPRIVLRVLDGIKVESGHVWNDKAKAWEARAPEPASAS